jgi:hypothetical protein
VAAELRQPVVNVFLLPIVACTDLYRIVKIHLVSSVETTEMTTVGLFSKHEFICKFAANAGSGLGLYVRPQRPKWQNAT